MVCEYCKTKNKGDKYHPGTCENCGAIFHEQENTFSGKQPEYTWMQYDLTEFATTCSTVTDIFVRKPDG